MKRYVTTFTVKGRKNIREFTDRESANIFEKLVKNIYNAYEVKTVCYRVNGSVYVEDKYA